MHDDKRPNGQIPEVGSTLKVDGLDFMVTVQKVEKTSALDGNGEPVCMIYIRAPNRTLQAMLPSRYLNSQTATYVIEEETEEQTEDFDELEWQTFKPSNEIQRKVRKYIIGIGWCDGEITSTKRRIGNPTEIRYTVAYDDEAAPEEKLNSEEYTEAAKFGSMDSPPRAPPLVLAALSVEKAAEEMRNSEMEHTVSPNGGIHPPPPNGDLTSSIVPYDGAGLSIGELVAQANNIGLGFTNPYHGIGSIAKMETQRELNIRRREIFWKNDGAWATVYASRDLSESQFNPEFSFPPGFTNDEKLPMLSLAIAEIPFKYSSGSGAFNGNRAFSRGSVYNALNQLGNGESDNCDVYYFLHVIVKEGSKGHRLFGTDMFVVTVLSKYFEDKTDGRIIVVNKSSVRDKSLIPESQLKDSLGLDDGGLRSILQNADANFVAWITKGSPSLNNNNTRRVSRKTDALGERMFPPVIDIDPVNTETAKKKQQ